MSSIRVLHGINCPPQPAYLLHKVQPKDKEEKKKHFHLFKQRQTNDSWNKYIISTTPVGAKKTKQNTTPSSLYLSPLKSGGEKSLISFNRT